MWRSLLGCTFVAAIGTACVATLLVLFGGWENIAGGRLTARVLLHDLKVPSSYSIDDKQISDELVRRMKRRAETDAALQIMLRAKGTEMLRDRAIPRLVNAGVVRRMIAEMDGLASVIDFAGYGSWAEIVVTNSGATALEDVAMTMPYAARAEIAASPLKLTSHKDGLTAMALGRLEPGASVTLAVWLAQSADAFAARRQDVLLGADGGVRGIVRLHDPGRAWNGARLEYHSWARWLIAAILFSIVFLTIAGIMLILVSLARARLVSRA